MILRPETERPKEGGYIRGQSDSKRLQAVKGRPLCISRKIVDGGSCSQDCRISCGRRVRRRISGSQRAARRFSRRGISFKTTLGSSPDTMGAASRETWRLAHSSGRRKSACGEPDDKLTLTTNIPPMSLLPPVVTEGRSGMTSREGTGL